MGSIKDLYQEMQKNEVLLDRISGELTLHGKSIVWTYKIENDFGDEREELEEYDDDDFAGFEPISIDEILNCTYEEDLEEIRDNICELEIYDSLVFSEPKIKANVISFKITL